MSDDEDNIPVLNETNEAETDENVSKQDDAKEEEQVQDIQNVSEECKQKFANYMTQFIDALCSVFPEDIQLGLVKTKLNLAIGSSFNGDEETREGRKKQMIEKWHTVMKKH